MTLSSNDPSVNRPYRAPRREAQAEATRDAILAAAHELFLTHGYAGTSIRAVAEAAQVSDQTVYSNFGDKPSLLAEVGLRVVSGPAVGDTGQPHDFAADLLARDDIRERIKIVAAWSRRVWEGGMLRFEAMLLDAAGADPRAAEIAGAMWERKHEENKQLFTLLVPPGSLPDGDEFDEAYDIAFALDSAAFVRILIEDREWSWDTYERWLAIILTRLYATAY